jgi:hypothetical protein
MMTRRRGAALALAVTTMLGAGACAAGRVSLGTNAGACFQALPPAEKAVHDKGKLVGVRRVSTTALRAGLSRNTTLATLPDQELCVFAFSGPFGPGSVTGARETAAGRYAIILVSTKHPAVLGAVVTNTLPTRFRHLH